MRNILTLLSAAALLAVPTAAQARGLDSNFSQAVTGPIKLEIVVSEDLAVSYTHLTLPTTPYV